MVDANGVAVEGVRTLPPKMEIVLDEKRGIKIKSELPTLTVGIREYLKRHAEAGKDFLAEFKYDRDDETLRAELAASNVAIPAEPRELMRNVSQICRMLGVTYVNSAQAHPNEAKPSPDSPAGGNGSAPTDAVALLRQYRKDGEEMAKIQKRRAAAEKFLRGAGLAHLIDKQTTGRKRK